ncbi:Asp23/Gls24 family envelope stress response protein [Streptomyces kunmingensis]|uniref:Asp23/Gls24 family envelope stress response protein n=1 Tax=Streptomyces kunmingensis TaxID=68225 RepID=A0ABU6CA28_9ACTN|nr:Asp23/Gls24 family envelope stress response protein [Streptomyces kunmingensis]MEB3961571.1 Asp23/Gls24 family envelope stress response protein [Streptomyces kunmingensis]
MSDIAIGSGSTTTGSAQKGGTRGTTSIADGVIATIAGIAVRETDGVRAVGKGAAKALGAVRSRMPGSPDPGQSVKVERDEEKVSVGVDVEVEYGVLIHELADQIRTHVIDAVETMTGLDVNEININVFDVHIPDDDEDADADADDQ